MTDYFALLHQPRQPWLHLEKLKQVFHEETLRAHPDARVPGVDGIEAEGAFAQINEAYQVLRDPRRRLHHLLSLEGQAPAAAGGPIPQEIADVFQTVAASTQAADRVVQKAAAAINPLSRALLRGELVQACSLLNEALDTLLRLRTEADVDLQQLNNSFAETVEDRFVGLSSLFLRYSYLTRWISQLEEKKTHLSAC